MTLEWKEEYSVGVSEIDAQHKRLFELVNKIDEIATDRKGKLVIYYKDILRIIDELGDYAVTHFYDEEMAMEECGCPDYEEHKMKHELFSDEVSNIRDNLVNDENFRTDENRLAELLSRLSNFLGNWLTNHILVVDMKYKDRVRKV